MLTFYVVFLNTAILLLLVNANMTAQPISFGLAGAMSDFNSDWFRLTGNTIRSTMVFNCFYPIMEFGMFFTMRLAFRLMDSCRLNKYETKTKSIQAYINVHCGPNYLMHFKYSSILNIIFVTFMYGFGIPDLYPIAAASFIIIYIIEQCQLYYSYKQPPMYDERLSQSVLSKLMWAPFIGIAFAYWMASSNQLYSNKWLNQITTGSEVFQAQHNMQSVFWKSGWAAPAWPLLLTAIMIQVIIWAGESLIELVSKFVPCCIIGDMTLDEDIPIYWEGLDENDRHWAIEEEKNSRNALGGLKIITDDAFEKLKASKEND